MPSRGVRNTMPALRVEVVYALSQGVDCVRLELAAGATAADAVQASALLARHPELDKRPLILGIFGRRVSAAQALRDGDRVELYRSLREDPRSARRARAVRRRAE